MSKQALVTGAAGFIGSHLVKYLLGLGYRVRGVDIKEGADFGWLHDGTPNEYLRLDLRSECACACAFEDAYFDEVYHLAANMGGIGFITSHHATITRDNALINLHMLEAARRADVGSVFYSSSACVYPAHLQINPDVGLGLKESDAWPAAPEKGYGLEKLFAEELYAYYAEQYNMRLRVARFHNVYGPFGTYRGGREKAPAALCRKVAEAAHNGVVEIWGDGQQTRSFFYIDDCVEGIHRLMESTRTTPLNLGSSELVTIDQLADMVIEASGKKLDKAHVPGPQGVRGRNCDPTEMGKALQWSPEVSWCPKVGLKEGIAKTYSWIEREVKLSRGVFTSAPEVEDELRSRR